VHRATDPLLARDVAVKLFRPERVPPGHGSEGVLEEARRLAQVRHPNVILVHGADVHAGRAGLWTELLRGETLEQSLERRGPFSADEAALVGAELCAALAAIHAAELQLPESWLPFVVSQ
jgi:serine/threonine protein kinase